MTTETYQPTEAQLKAIELIKACAVVNGYREPCPNVTPWDELVTEFWHNDRKLTLYADGEGKMSYVKSWDRGQGTPCRMTQREINEGDLHEGFGWLQEVLVPQTQMKETITAVEIKHSLNGCLTTEEDGDLYWEFWNGNRKLSISANADDTAYAMKIDPLPAPIVNVSIAGTAELAPLFEWLMNKELMPNMWEGFISEQIKRRQLDALRTSENGRVSYELKKPIEGGDRTLGIDLYADGSSNTRKTMKAEMKSPVAECGELTNVRDVMALFDWFEKG